MNSKNIIITIVIIILVPLGFWYFIWPAFRQIEVNDELPPGLDVVSSTNDNSGTDVVNAPSTDDSDIVDITDNTNDDSDSTEDTTTDESESDVIDEEEVVETPREVVRETRASITERVAVIQADRFHPASGYARVFTDEDGNRFLRFEELETIDGPRLNVYLMADLDANDFIDLGRRKATNGNINYEIPEGVDLNKYKFAAHWCVPFSVLFNYADISQ